ncbi:MULTISPECIES: Flp family type IVb pilin [unclassified Rhizobium]|uniref:Flp family type IVb pilin n=1 Tax=unclassified Rhizobium TaxID=2613769 RepID=UPI0016007048|nr:MULTISPECIES: Flp family type IVb pilin [unclassified Rhizobium]MBB1249405.1 Flp family type IVb pilin [Rhizobium sp. G21]MCV3768461.1 Flp family type IVb pilin [Rhizobium sp. TRM95796]
MTKLIESFLTDRSGATAVEYGLIAAIISVALLGGFGAFSNRLNGQFYGISNTIENAWAGQ